MLEIVVNGKNEVFEDAGTNITQILNRQEVKNPEMVAVYVNQTIIDKSEYDATTFQSGDEVEIIYFMGGGCAPGGEGLSRCDGLNG